MADLSKFSRSSWSRALEWIGVKNKMTEDSYNKPRMD